MPNPAHASNYPGLALLILASTMSLLSACAPMRQELARSTGNDGFQFWSQAVQAEAPVRNQLLKDAEAQDDRWRMAMLRSIPGPDYVGASTAQGRLRNLLDSGLPNERAALAQLRIRELSQLGNCEVEVSNLRGTVHNLQTKAEQMRNQVDQIVNIEQQIEHAP